MKITLLIATLLSLLSCSGITEKKEKERQEKILEITNRIEDYKRVIEEKKKSIERDSSLLKYYAPLIKSNQDLIDKYERELKLIQSGKIPLKPKQHVKNNLLAYNYASDFIKSKLKSPSSAKFPSIRDKDQHVSYVGEGKYNIVSWVESKNSIGVMMRQKFSCTIVFTEKDVKCQKLIFFD